MNKIVLTFVALMLIVIGIGRGESMGTAEGTEPRGNPVSTTTANVDIKNSQYTNKSIVETVAEVKATKDKSIKRKLTAGIRKRTLNSEAEINALIELLGKENDEYVLNNIQTALQNTDLDNKQFEKIFIKALSDSNPNVKLTGIANCGRYKTKSVVPDLIKIVKEKKVKSTSWLYCYTSAMLALGEIGDPQAIPVLIEVLKDQKDSAAHYGVPTKSLRIFGEKVLPKITSLGNSLDEDKDKNYIHELGNVIDGIEDKNAIPKLFDILLNENNKRWLRVSAAGTIGRIGDENDIDKLISMYNDKIYFKIKRIVYSGLLSSMNKKVIPILAEELRNEPDYTSRISKIFHLERIGGSEVVAVLEDVHKNDTVPQVRERAAEALKNLSEKKYKFYWEK